MYRSEDKTSTLELKPADGHVTLAENETVGGFTTKSAALSHYSIAERTQAVIVAITGASGVLYGVKILQILHAIGIQTHLVISNSARITIARELDISIEEVLRYSDFTYHNNDIKAPLASGSRLINAMIIAPCSMKTMSEIACGIGSTLIARAADVALKERRKLLLMVRETPLHSGHLERMLHLSRIGAIIYPPVNAFYIQPTTIDDLVEYTAIRALDAININVVCNARWNG